MPVSEEGGQERGQEGHSCLNHVVHATNEGGGAALLQKEWEGLFAAE